MKELEFLAESESESAKERTARFRKLKADLTASVDLLGRSDDNVLRVWAACLLGDAHARVGDLGRAESTMKLGIAQGEAAGDVWACANTRARLGIVQWQRGDLESARENLQHALCAQRRIGHRWGMAMSFEGLAYVAASAGEYERAARLIGALHTLWNNVGTKLHTFMKASHDRCVACVTRELGEVQFRSNFQRGAEMPLSDVLAYALGEAEAAPLNLAGRPAHCLSRREMDVARLVADGSTNREIAAALRVAEGTVKTHIEHILNKLGVASRAQIAVWLTRQLGNAGIGAAIHHSADVGSARRR